MTNELTNFAMKVHNLVFGTNYNDPEIVESMDLDRITDKMKKDHDDWIEEITDKTLFILLSILISGHKPYSHEAAANGI